MREVRLPSVVPLRACIDLEDGVVAVVYKEPHPQLPDKFYITLLACNVSELLCSYWIGDPPDLLAALIVGEAARRAASRHPNPAARSKLLELAESAERILKPIARFILGEEVDVKDLTNAMRRHAEIYKHSLVTIFEPPYPEASFTILDKLKEALGEEDFQKLRKMLEGAVERSYLGIGPFMGFTFAYLRVSRGGMNTLLPDDAVGAILAVALKPEDLKFESAQHMLDAIDVGARPLIYTFKSREILDIATKTLKETSFDSYAILYVVKRFDDNIDTFTYPLKGDVLRLVETYINAYIESYEKDSVVSRIVRLSDGRKLHIIVPREPYVVDKFENTILLLSNHEIKATFLYNFIDSGYIENNEGVVKYIAGMNEEDLARLDDETIDAILELLVQRALFSTFTR